MLRPGIDARSIEHTFFSGQRPGVTRGRPFRPAPALSILKEGIPVSDLQATLEPFRLVMVFTCTQFAVCWTV